MKVVFKILGTFMPLYLGMYSRAFASVGHVDTAMDPVFGLPRPPVDFPYDFTSSLGASISSIVLFLVVAAFAAVNARKRKTIFPLVVACSGLLFGIPEVVIDVLGGCYWGVDNNQVVFTILGRPMTWMPLCSWLAFGAIQIYTTYSLLSRNASTKSLWICYSLMCLLDIAFEEIELRIPGIYTYYGNQPFVLSIFPMWWMFVNASGCFFAAALIYRLEAYLQGWKSLSVFLVAPLAYMASFGFTGVPATIVINGNYSWLATQIGGLLTVGLALLSVMLTMSIVLHREPFKTNTIPHDLQTKQLTMN